MSIIGLVTNEGLTKSIEAASNGGWFIYPIEFRVASTKGVLSANRDLTSLEPTWYTAAISSKVDMSPNTIQCNCTIPPEQALSVEEIQEIYLIAEDQASNPFLLFIGQPDNTIFYDPSGAVSLRLQITIANIDITELYIFNYTQATEIYDHNNDPNAHETMLDDRMSEHNADPSANPAAINVHNISLDAHANILKAVAYKDVNVSYGMVYSAAAGDKIHCLTSYGEINIYLSEGNGEIKVIDEDCSCATNNINIHRNGITIHHKDEDLIMDVDGATVILNGSEGNYSFEYPLTILPSEAAP